MRLQASYNAMSDVPKGYESAYTEQDGKAVFTGGEFEFKTEEDVSAMSRAKDHANNELSAAKTKLKAFDGIDPKKHKTLLDEVDVLRAKTKGDSNDEETIKAIVDARVARATEELTAKNQSLESENNELKGFKSKTEKGSVIDKALGPNVSKAALADARFIIESAIERQADGTYMSNGTAGFEKGLTVDQLVTKAVESRPYWKKQNTPGHGAGGAGGGGALNKMSQLDGLIEKQKSGKITMAEKAQMTTLAAEIKAEQEGQQK